MKDAKINKLSIIKVAVIIRCSWACPSLVALCSIYRHFFHFFYLQLLCLLLYLSLSLHSPLLQLLKHMLPALLSLVRLSSSVWMMTLHPRSVTLFSMSTCLIGYKWQKWHKDCSSSKPYHYYNNYILYMWYCSLIACIYDILCLYT